MVFFENEASQAGPAQDPWPPKPSRPGPGPLAPQAKPARPRTLDPEAYWNAKCDPIGNSIKKIRISPIPILQIFQIFKICLKKRANAILKETYIRSTCITDQTKFIENC